MSIAVLHLFTPFRTLGADSANETVGLDREMLIAGRLADDGLRGGGEVHLISCELGSEPLSYRSLEVSDGVIRHIIATSTSGPAPQMVVAMAMQLLADIAPRATIVKGARSGLVELIRASVATCVIQVAGGRSAWNELASADIALVEKPTDEIRLRRIMPGNVRYLPKLIPSSFFVQPRNDDFDLAVVSDFVPWKNHAALISSGGEALVGLRIALLGDGPLRSEVADGLLSRGIDALFLGTVPRATVAAVLGSTRVLLHPSLSEGVPRCVAEAMCAGCVPVAVRRVVDFPIEDGVSGLLRGQRRIVRDAAALARDRNRCGALSQAARTQAEVLWGEAAMEREFSSLSRLVSTCQTGRSRRLAIRSRLALRRFEIMERASRLLIH